MSYLRFILNHHPCYSYKLYQLVGALQHKVYFCQYNSKLMQRESMSEYNGYFNFSYKFKNYAETINITWQKIFVNKKINRMLIIWRGESFKPQDRKRHVRRMATESGTPEAKFLHSIMFSSDYWVTLVI